jgi:hypothetical protein
LISFCFYANTRGNGKGKYTQQWQQRLQYNQYYSAEKKKNLKSTEKGGKPKECLAMHINSMNIYLACPQTPWNVELVQSPAFFMMWKASYS